MSAPSVPSLVVILAAPSASEAPPKQNHDERNSQHGADDARIGKRLQIIVVGLLKPV